MNASLTSSSISPVQQHRSKMDATRALYPLVILMTFLFSLVEEGLGIHCYMCKSSQHRECFSDKFEALTEERRRMYSINCDHLPGNRSYVTCRKIFQDVNDTESVVRQCAIRGEDGCTYRSGTRKVHVEYCQCSTDNCNTATATYTASVMSLFPSLYTLYTTVS